jgi:lipooligosaccharide transport system ATP-binding protein
MFLDEPSTGLDPQARHLIWERLRKLTSEGRTIVLTTHFMDEAERLCHRVAIIDHGRKIAEGTPRELITQYIEPQVVEVYGDGAEAWAETYGRSASERCEKTGETFFCYTRDADAIVHALDRESNVRYLHRPANLEDVFLKLTGRELRD